MLKGQENAPKAKQAEKDLFNRHTRTTVYTLLRTADSLIMSCPVISVKACLCTLIGVSV